MAKLTAQDIARVKGIGFLHNRGTEDRFSARVVTENGTMTAEQMMALSAAAKKFGTGEVCFTTRLTVEVVGIPYDQIEAFRAEIARVGLATGGTGSRVRPIVACKGTTCQYGNTDTQALAREIHKAFYEKYFDVKLPHKFKIAVGGCPNSCVKPSLNDVGIVALDRPNYDADKCRGCAKCGVETACPIGAAKMRDGKLVIDSALCNSCGRCVGKCHFDALPDGTKGFRIYLGGRWGKQFQHGEPLARMYSRDELFGVIESAILLYRENGYTGERFGQTIARLGLPFFENAIESGEIRSRKADVLAAELKTRG